MVICWIIFYHFRSRVLDTRVTYLQLDHCLVVSKVRLKLKAKWKRLQRETRYHLDRRLLEDHQVQDFVRVEEELESDPCS